MSGQSNTGYDEWLDALERGEGYYLESSAERGWLPPRRVCPETGETDLTERPLPEEGTVETFSIVHVAAPQFEEDTPYVTAVADFGPVRITGFLRGVDPEAAETGLAVTATVEESATDGDRVVVLRPA